MSKNEKKKEQLIKTMETCVEEYQFKETPEEINDEVERITKIMMKETKRVPQQQCIGIGIFIGMKIMEKKDI